MFYNTSKFIQFVENVDSWNQLEKKISLLPTEKERGDVFEIFAKYFLILQPEYNFENVWFANEAPQESQEHLGQKGQDIGIDLIAMTYDKKIWAIQVKFRSKISSIISYRELSTFLATGYRADFKLIITNTDDVTRHIKNRKDVGQILAGQLNNLNKDFFSSLLVFLKTSKAETFKKEPRSYQKKIIKKAKEYFAKESRGRIIMPPGSGKTLVCLWIKERIKTTATLVMVPSLALMRQTLGEWSHNSKERFDYLCVASDKTISEVLREDDDISGSWELDVPVTTNPKDVIKFIKKETKRSIIIFATYQSGDVIVSALKNESFSFDFAVYDEAHKTATIGEKLFNLTLNNRNLKIKKRLFVTATQRAFAEYIQHKGEEKNITVFSMDDERIYGKEIYRMSFAEAVRLKCLSDYKIIILNVTNEEFRQTFELNELVQLDEVDQEQANVLASKIALLKAVQKFGAKHFISFHANVRRAQFFTTESGFSLKESFSKLISQPQSNLSIVHVNGGMSTSQRASIIKSFVESPVGIITNVRCLTEGVDVPIVDAVCFVDPKYSKIDIVQAVGRALRLHENKKLGYVIIPIFLSNESADIVKIADSGLFNAVWNVVTAMQIQDERLDEIIKKVSFLQTGGEKSRKKLEQGLVEMRRKIEFVDFPERIIGKDIVKMLELLLVNRRSISWYYFYSLLMKYRTKNNFWPSNEYVMYNGHKLGKWFLKQRNAREKGNILSEFVKLLDDIGFPWNVWNEMYEALVCFHEEKKVWPPDNLAIVNGLNLGSWCTRQRFDKKKGIITRERLQLLNDIGFPWDKWLEKFYYLKQYRMENQNTWPQKNDFKDKYQLSSWCNSQKKAKKKNKITKKQIYLLESIEFPWDKWTEGYINLRKYLIENHGFYPVDIYYIMSNGFWLGEWCAKQREPKVKQSLSAEKINLLDKLDFCWDKVEFMWKSNYESLKIVLKEGVTYPNLSLEIKSWCRNQKLAKETNKISENHLRLLEKINFPW